MSQQPGELPGFDALSPQDRAIIKAQLASPQGVSQLFDNQEELDKAAAEASLHAWAPKGAGEPEWSVGQLMVERDGVFWIADVVRFRGNAVDGVNRISQPAEKAGRQAPIFSKEKRVFQARSSLPTTSASYRLSFRCAAPDQQRRRMYGPCRSSAASAAGRIRWSRAPRNTRFLTGEGTALARIGSPDGRLETAAHALLTGGRGAPFTNH